MFEVGKFDDSSLMVLYKVGKVSIAADNIVSPDGIGQCKEIKVFRVTDG